MPPRRASRSSSQTEPTIKQYFTQPERASKRIKREHESPVKQETHQSVKQEEDDNPPVKRETRRSIKREDSNPVMKNEADEQSLNEEKNADDDDDQSADEPDDDYEALRLANIRRNADQLRQLAIPSLVLAQPSQSSQPRRQSVRAPKPESQPVRRSMRNRGLNPDNTVADVVREAEAEAAAEKIRREGPIDMDGAIVVVRGRNLGLLSQYDPEKDVAAVEQIEEDEEETGDNEEKTSEHNPLTDRLCSTISTFVAARSANQSNIPSLTEDRIKSFELVGMTNKLTKKRTSAMVFHPSSSLDRSVLFTGDKTGLLNVSVFDSARHLQKTDDRNFGVCLNAHDGTINNILCHSFSQRVYTSSNDGFIRSLDVDRQSITAAFGHDQCIYGLTSPADSPHTIYASDIR